MNYRQKKKQIKKKRLDIAWQVYDYYKRDEFVPDELIEEFTKLNNRLEDIHYKKLCMKHRRSKRERRLIWQVIERAKRNEEAALNEIK